MHIVEDVSILKKNADINIIIAIGKEIYPKILWANFQVSSSLIVQGSLNPKYLLNGILGAEFPNTITRIDTKVTITISLFSKFNKFLVDGIIVNK